MNATEYCMDCVAVVDTMKCAVSASWYYACSSSFGYNSYGEKFYCR